MRLPPVTNEYKSAVQTELQVQLERADDQNIKLDKDNFLETGSICLKNSDGEWYKLGVNTSDQLTVTKLTGKRLDSAGRPVISSTNPYYVAP